MPRWRRRLVWAEGGSLPPAIPNTDFERECIGYFIGVFDWMGETAVPLRPVATEGAWVSGVGKGVATDLRRIAALWPLKAIELTLGMELSGDSKLSCVSCRLARGRGSGAMLAVGLTYT